MNTKKKTPDKSPITLHEQAVVEVVRYLTKTFSNSTIDIIYVVQNVLEIQIKALSFLNVPKDELEKVGAQMIVKPHESILRIWEEDRKHRKEKKSDEKQI